MKHFILVFFSLLSVPTLCLAQQEQGKLQIGLMGGPTQTNFTRQNNTLPHLNIEKDYRGTAGISVKYLFSKLFLETDVLYENKGYKTDLQTYNSDGRENWSGDLNYNYHYLTLPLLVGVSIGQSGLYINAGPYAAALLRQAYSYEGTKANRPTNSGNGSTSWKKMDYGLAGGIGYAHAVRSGLLLSAEVRHNEGLRNISQGPIGFKSRSTALLVSAQFILR